MFNRILVPVMNPQMSKPTIDAAIAIAKGNDAQIILLHVVNEDKVVSEGGVGFVTFIPGEPDSEARLCVDISMQMVQAAGLLCEGHIVKGQPGKAILAFMKEQNVDLAVLGRRDRGLVEKILIGSVSQHVLDHAHCPVLIIK